MNWAHLHWFLCLMSAKQKHTHATTLWLLFCLFDLFKRLNVNKQHYMIGMSCQQCSSLNNLRWQLLRLHHRQLSLRRPCLLRWWRGDEGSWTSPAVPVRTVHSSYSCCRSRWEPGFHWLLQRASYCPSSLPQAGCFIHLHQPLRKH